MRRDVWFLCSQLVLLLWIFSSDRLDIGAARTLLDNDHYALDKLKKRVLEYLAVRQLKTLLKVLQVPLRTSCCWSRLVLTGATDGGWGGWFY